MFLAATLRYLISRDGCSFKLRQPVFGKVELRMVGFRFNCIHEIEVDRWLRVIWTSVSLFANVCRVHEKDKDIQMEKM